MSYGQQKSPTIHRVRLNNTQEAINHIQTRITSGNGCHLILYADQDLKNYKCFKRALKSRLGGSCDFVPRQLLPSQSRFRIHCQSSGFRFNQQSQQQRAEYIFGNCFVVPSKKEGRSVTAVTLVGMPKNEDTAKIFLRCLSVAVQTFRVSSVQAIQVALHMQIQVGDCQFTEMQTQQYQPGGLKICVQRLQIQ